MRKNLLLASLLFAGGLFTMNAQTVLFEDSFESYTDFEFENISPWTLLDQDGAMYNYTIQNYTFPNQGELPSFIVFNPALTTPSLTGESALPHSGDKYMAAFASYNLNEDETAVIPVTQSDWLISPQITLGDSGNNVSFWAKSYTTQYGAERFNVLVSTTDTNPSSFTKINEGDYTTVQDAWEEFSYNLDAYSGQQVYIAIQCVSHDSFIFMVDDFSVTTTGTVSVDSVLAGSFSVYPNPAKDMLNISNSIGAEINSVIVTDINGRTVKQVAVNGVESQINIADLNAGVYFVNINSNQGSLTKKIVKQ